MLLHLHTSISPVERIGHDCSAFSSPHWPHLPFFCCSLPLGAATWTAHTFPGPEFPHFHVCIIVVSHHLSHLLSSPCCYKNLRHIYVRGEKTCTHGTGWFCRWIYNINNWICIFDISLVLYSSLAAFYWKIIVVHVVKMLAKSALCWMAGFIADTLLMMFLSSCGGRVWR